MTDELLDLVDKNDNVIGAVWKSQAHKDPTNIHREIAIAVFNEKGETLFHQRSLSKEFDPGVWQLTASGHVKQGENPEKAAIRECKEEVGLVVKPLFVKKEFIEDGKEARFFYVYYAVVNGKPKVKINKKEVNETMWILPLKLDQFEAKGNTVDWKSKQFVLDVYSGIFVLK